MATEHSTAFNNAKAALVTFAGTLEPEQRKELNGLVARFVSLAVSDYKGDRDRQEAAVNAARKAMDSVRSSFLDAISGSRL